MMRRWWMTGLGSGYSPIASGTAGSAVAIVIAMAAWATVTTTGVNPLLLDVTWVILTLLASLGCVVWGPWAIKYFAELAKKSGKKPEDPGHVVLDEWAGQWIALLAIPMPTFERAAAVLIVQFFVFRLFDIIKPPPARQFEKLPAGWGILMDDLAAGVYANIIGQIVFRLCV